MSYCRQMYLAWCQEIKETCANEYFPNKQVILSAIASCLASSDPLIVRKMLDFIIEFITPFPLIFDQEEHIVILKLCIQLLDNSDYSLRKRAFHVLFRYEVPDGEEPMLETGMLELIVEALRRILRESALSKDPRVFKIL